MRNPIGRWLLKKRLRREEHDALWAPYKIRLSDGLARFQVEFEKNLLARLAGQANIAREIEVDREGQIVLWLTVHQSDLQIAVGYDLIQIGGKSSYEEWDAETPEALIAKAIDEVLLVSGA